MNAHRRRGDVKGGFRVSIAHFDRSKQLTATSPGDELPDVADARLQCGDRVRIN
jgi:hypothetical protein